MSALPAQKAVVWQQPRPSSPTVSRFQFLLFPSQLWGLELGEGNLASGRTVG